MQEKIRMMTKSVYDANILNAEAGTNGLRGGDAGHGGVTTIALADGGQTRWKIGINDGDGKYHLFDQPENVTITMYGDAELRTLVKSLESMVSHLKLVMEGELPVYSDIEPKDLVM
jgi:hypothetical protein